MENTFSFSRFGRYFKYDFRRWVSTYGLSLLLMSAAPLILYTVTLVYSLLFSQEWNTPGETSRIIVAWMVSAVLVLTCSSNAYGYVTDKRAGSAFVMIPASLLEKCLSMILNVAVVIPLVFGVIYLSLDGVICLIDGTCGGTLFSVLWNGLKELAMLPFASDAPLRVSLLSVYLNLASSILFFLLGAIIFRKHKILYPILIIVGFQMLMGILFGFFITAGILNPDAFSTWMEHVAGRYLLNPEFLGWAVPAYNFMATAFDVLVFVALAVAVYYRLKTIKH